jgi:hypothetical protein
MIHIVIEGARCLLHDGGIGVGGFLFVGVDLAVVFGIEGAMLGVEVAGRHGEDETVFLAFETGGVVAAVGIDHAFGEGAGVDEFGEGCGEMAVLFIELALGAENDAHIAKGGGFRVRACGVAGKFWLVGGGGSLGGRSCFRIGSVLRVAWKRRGSESRSRCEQSGGGQSQAGDDGKTRIETVSHAESSPRVARRKLARQSPLWRGFPTFFFMLLP